jgi:hypothetical protein
LTFIPAIVCKQRVITAEWYQNFPNINKLWQTLMERYYWQKDLQGQVTTIQGTWTCTSRNKIRHLTAPTTPNILLAQTKAHKAFKHDVGTVLGFMPVEACPLWLALKHKT